MLARDVPNGHQLGTYLWPVSGPETSRARIRVTAQDGSTDVNDVAFTIRSPTIAITSPNISSEIWTAGEPATVRWTGNIGSQEEVRLDLSTDGGRSYPIVLADRTLSDGAEIVAVHSSWATTAARVRITWRRNGRRDTSDARRRLRADRASGFR